MKLLRVGVQLGVLACWVFFSLLSTHVAQWLVARMLLVWLGVGRAISGGFVALCLSGW